MIILDTAAVIGRYPLKLREAISEMPRPAKLALKLMDHVNGFGAHNWDQRHYGKDELPTAENVDMGYASMASEPCGSSFCVAGEAVMMLPGVSFNDRGDAKFRFEGQEITPFNVAASMLGLTTLQAHAMFSASKTRDYVLRRLERVITDDHDALPVPGLKAGVTE